MQNELGLLEESALGIPTKSSNKTSEVRIL